MPPANPCRSMFPKEIKNSFRKSSSVNLMHQGSIRNVALRSWRLAGNTGRSVAEFDASGFFAERGQNGDRHCDRAGYNGKREPVIVAVMRRDRRLQGSVDRSDQIAELVSETGKRAARLRRARAR